MTKKTRCIVAIVGGAAAIATIGAVVALTVLAKKGGSKQWPILKNLNEIDDSSEKVPRRYFTPNAK